MNKFNEWFENLSQSERKEIVCAMFEAKALYKLSYKGDKVDLLTELVSNLDDYYHELK